MGKQTFNSKTFRVTAPNGVTNRIWFDDYAGNVGVIAAPARSVKIKNRENAGGNSAFVALGLLEGAIDTANGEEIDPKGAETYDDGMWRCLAYQGNGGNVILEVTVQW